MSDRTKQSLVRVLKIMVFAAAGALVAFPVTQLEAAPAKVLILIAVTGAVGGLEKYLLWQEQQNPLPPANP